jgi:hypothetical protein
MVEKPQILVEPGNPFGFDPEEFAELVDTVRKEVDSDFDVRVGHREQVGAAVTLHEVVDFWLSWEAWSTAAQAVLLEQLLGGAVRWWTRRRERHPEAPFRPLSARVIVARDKTVVVGEVKIGTPGGEPEYRMLPRDRESIEDAGRSAPPVRPWPPSEGDLPQRPGQERARRRIMLEEIHVTVKEAQRRGRPTAVYYPETVAAIGETMGLNAVESDGLFRRLAEGAYLRIRDTRPDLREAEDSRLEVEYLSDLGLREIGEL